MNSPVSQKIATFFAAYQPTKFKKGEVIIEANKLPLGLYFLTNGFVRQYVFTESGQELTLHFFKPGSFFPLFWIINDQPNRYFYQAFTDIEVHIAPKDVSVDFLKTNPDILLDLTGRLLFGLDGLLTRIESLASASARDRTIGILLFLGKHFGKSEGHGLTLTQQFTHNDLANLTGLTRETTSREVEQLTKAGLITTNGRFIHIPNLESLTKVI